MSGSRRFVDYVLIAVAILAIAKIISASWGGSHVPSVESIDATAAPRARAFQRVVPLGQSPLFGDTRAELAIIEFSEFECPFCRQFATTVFPSLRERYTATGRVVISFRHLPLTSIHPLALAAARLGACAALNHSFWEYHDLIYARNGPLSAAMLSELSSNPNLVFAQACRDEQAQDTVREDRSLAESLGITGTPTFLFGYRTGGGQDVQVMRRIDGVAPIATFAAEIDGLADAAKHRATR